MDVFQCEQGRFARDYAEAANSPVWVNSCSLKLACTGICAIARGAEEM
jgi:hypothetical protein